MTIDWITVSAQIINFLILVVLLRYFLYQPVLNAMARREQRITGRLTQAREREEEADEKARQYENESGKLEQQRSEILEQARAQAEEEKKRLLKEAREEVATARQEWQREVDEEKTRFIENLKQGAAEAVQRLGRKALADLADTGLEQQVVANFLNRMESLDRETLQELGNGPGPLRIHSAFELDSATRGRLTRAVHERIAADLEVDYDQSPGLLCGIQISSGDRVLGWNLSAYLDELDSRVEKAFGTTGTPAESG